MSEPSGENRQRLLRMIPGVDRLLALAADDLLLNKEPRGVLLRAARDCVDRLRKGILEDEASMSEDRFTQSAVTGMMRQTVAALNAPNLRAAVNATGVVVHTNLGRSLLARSAVENLADIAARYSNLEYDIEKGVRGTRYAAVETLLCELCGAEAAMVVNNNAGAVLLCLDTIAKNRKVVVSRGELVEIGGSFRIPDVMAKSGAVLVEVGTTNRTHRRDYIGAIDPDTALLLKVHQSNYYIVGFTAAVPLKSLVEIGKTHGIPVMEDLGSGTLVDFSRWGLAKEPTIQESVASGADIVTFSGDKLLGGPQAGIIVGKRDVIERIKANPLTRALRIDKLTLAALESTLRLYRDEANAVENIPTLQLLTMPLTAIEKKVDRFESAMAYASSSGLRMQRIRSVSKAGGGSLPFLEIPTICVKVAVEGYSASTLERFFRLRRPPIIGRIEDDAFVLDLRTVWEDEIPLIVETFKQLLAKDPS